MTESSGIRLTAEELLEHSGWAQTLARQLLADREGAEDLVQDTWLAALERPPSIRRSWSSWLQTAIRRAAAHRDQSERARRTRETRTARHDPVPAAADLVERAQGQRLLVDLVLELPEPYRSTLLLRYFEDLSLAEIARKSGSPPSTIRVHHQRALEELRQRLAARAKNDPEAWRAFSAFLIGSGAWAPTGSSVGAATLGALLMMTKAKLACAAVLLLSLVAVVTWQRSGRISPDPEPTSRGLSHEVAAAALPARGPGPSPATRTSTPAAPNWTRIRVVDASGLPVPETVIVAAQSPLRSLSDPGYQVIGVADAKGTVLCDLAALDPRLVLLSGHHPAFITAVASRPTDDSEMRLMMRPGETARFEFKALGRPVPGVVVRMSRSRLDPRNPEDYAPVPTGLQALPGSAGRHNLFTASSDEAGRAVVTGLPPGKYLFQVECLNHVPNLKPNQTFMDSIDVPMAGPVAIDLVEVWVYALDIDTAAPDCLTWNHPGRISMGYVSHYESQVSQRLQREWPGRFIDVAAFPFPGGAPPPDLKIPVLHTSGVSENSVRPVRLVEFVRPQPEAPLTPSAEPTSSAMVTVRFVLPGGQKAEGFRSYSVKRVGSSPFKKDWNDVYNPTTDSGRLREGTYQISPSWSSTESDFDPLTFRVEANRPTLDVEVHLKRNLRSVKLEVSSGPLSGPVERAYVRIKCTDGITVLLTNTKARMTPWFPIGMPLEITVEDFGSLAKVVNATVDPGDGPQIIRIGLEDAPD